MARDDEEREGGDGGLDLSAGLIGAAIVAVLLAWFIFQNTAEAKVEVLLWDFTGPLWVVLFGTAVLAIVLFELATMIRRRRR